MRPSNTQIVPRSDRAWAITLLTAASLNRANQDGRPVPLYARAEPLPTRVALSRRTRCERLGARRPLTAASPARATGGASRRVSRGRSSQLTPAHWKRRPAPTSTTCWFGRDPAALRLRGLRRSVREAKRSSRGKQGLTHVMVHLHTGPIRLLARTPAASKLASLVLSPKPDRAARTLRTTAFIFSALGARYRVATEGIGRPERATTSSEERRLVPTHNVGAGGTRAAGGPFAGEAATRRSALRLLQPDRGGQEVGANSECPRADEGRSTAADGAGLASGQSRDARVRGPQPRMPTRSEWRFAMNSGARPRRLRGHEGACGSPESVTGSKHSAAVALILRAGISPGPLIPSATDDEHELPTGSRCLEWLLLAADIAAFPDRARDVAPSRI